MLILTTLDNLQKIAIYTKLKSILIRIHKPAVVHSNADWWKYPF